MTARHDARGAHLLGVICHGPEGIALRVEIEREGKHVPSHLVLMQRLCLGARMYRYYLSAVNLEGAGVGQKAPDGFQNGGVSDQLARRRRSGDQAPGAFSPTATMKRLDDKKTGSASVLSYRLIFR